MQIPRNAVFAATVLVATLATPALAADFAEGGDFGGTYRYIGPGAAYDYVEVAPVYPAPVYPAPAYVAPGYAAAAPLVDEEIVETDIVTAPPIAGYYAEPIDAYGDEYVAVPPPGYVAPPVGYAPPPMIDDYAAAPYDDVTVVGPDAGLAVGLDY